jgi:hypothetical protein
MSSWELWMRDRGGVEVVDLAYKKAESAVIGEKPGDWQSSGRLSQD